MPVSFYLVDANTVATYRPTCTTAELLCNASSGAFTSVCFYSRCIEDFNQLSGETNKAASPGVLVQAVETCFIGKRFIFGVKVIFNLRYSLVLSFSLACIQLEP